MKIVLPRFFLTALILWGSVLCAGELHLETDTGRLKGTFALAGGDKKLAVFIHPGSGPTDRDGNSAALPGKNDSLKQLAESITAGGFASLRIDKRGIAASREAGLKESDLRFETYIDDTVAWISELKRLGYGKIVVAGHSVGSLIGMIAARKAKADGFISIAGPSQKAGDVVRDQLQASMLKEVEIVIEALEAGDSSKDCPAGLEMLFRPSVQPYLASWFAYDPKEEIRKLEVPTLVVQGTTDVQVPEKSAKELGDVAKNATVVVIDGMNHVLKEVDGDLQAQLPSYSDPSLPLHPGLEKAVVEFLQGLAE